MSPNLDRRQRPQSFPAAPLQRRGVTLMELVLALTIVSVLGTAVVTMLIGAGNTQDYVIGQTDSLSQVENAYRQVLHNVRTASALSYPSDSSVHSQLTLSTQPDPNYGNVPATVNFQLSGTNLIETDSRYGSTQFTVAANVATFSVTKVATSPTQVNVQIITSTTPPVTRSTTITCRNF